MPKRDSDGKGNDILGPVNPDRMRQEPDHVRPPKEDTGKMPNMKWCVHRRGPNPADSQVIHRLAHAAGRGRLGARDDCAGAANV